MFILLLLLIFVSCEQKQLMKLPLKCNATSEKQQNLETKPIDHFEPWGVHLQPFPPITKNYFRCRGSSLHPPKVLNDSEYLFDCDGFESHSLPIVEGEEKIEPILIELVNYLQQRTQKKVIVTSGHRCPKHQIYLSEKKDLYAKYQVGAQVDFYIEAMEENSERVIELLEEFFALPFERYHKPSDVSTPPWFNREIFVKLYTKQEGRNEDNTHPYPYFSIQVRYDRYSKKPVRYDWNQAYKGFRRG